MTTYDYEIGVNDLEPPLEITLSLNGTAFVLVDGDVITLSWIRPNGVRVTGPMSVVNAATGLVRRSWDAGDTLLPGVYEGEVIIVRGGRQRTFPSDPDVFRWRVNPSV